MKCVIEFGVRGGAHTDNLVLPNCKLGARLAARMQNLLTNDPRDGLEKSWELGPHTPRVSWTSDTHFIALSRLDGVPRGDAGGRDGLQNGQEETNLKAQSEDRTQYDVVLPVPQDDDATIARALEILDRRLERGIDVTSPAAARDWLCLRLVGLEREVFGAVWLDSQNRVIAPEELFLGTLNQAAVYPREVVKAALRYNAAGVILYHNHPSGVTTPSRADEQITRQLKTALALVDVRVLDHFVVAGGHATSFAEKGLL